MQRVLLFLLLMPGMMQAAELVSRGSEMTDQDAVDLLAQWYTDRHAQAEAEEGQYSRKVGILKADIFRFLQIIDSRALTQAKEANAVAPYYPDKALSDSLRSAVDLVKQDKYGEADKKISIAIMDGEHTRGLSRFSDTFWNYYTLPQKGSLLESDHTLINVQPLGLFSTERTQHSPYLAGARGVVPGFSTARSGRAVFSSASAAPAALAGGLVSSAGEMTDQDAVNNFFDCLLKEYKATGAGTRTIFKLMVVIQSKRVKDSGCIEKFSFNVSSALPHIISLAKSGNYAEAKNKLSQVFTENAGRMVGNIADEFWRKHDIDIWDVSKFVLTPEDRIIGLPGFSTATTRPLLPPPALSAAVASGKAASALPPVSVSAAAAPATIINMPIKDDRDGSLRNPAPSAAPARRAVTWQRAVAVATVAGIVGALAWWFLKTDIQINTQHVA